MMLKTAYESAIGHPTSDSTVYNLLHRHGWRKPDAAPVPSKRNLAAQDAFKKQVFGDAVRKAKRAAAKRGRRLRVMFADEAALRTHEPPAALLGSGWWYRT